MSIHGGGFSIHEERLLQSDDRLFQAVVAIRVYALHNGRRYVRWFLWISGAVYLAASIIIITVVQIPVIGT